ncbi:MAG TPA: T9SS type A sorting domain-containing protein [Ferruginibacter sp.]|nr:T9SS type A sorting domain-containing protein [Ferruginibacter sp.]
MKNIIRSFLLVLISSAASAQSPWTPCNAPSFGTRVDDIYMVDTQVGYAVCGDGKIVKTVDGGNNWFQLLENSSVYCRSVEFINRDTGFVGGFPINGNVQTNIFRRTTDGGATWVDLTSQLHPRARRGVCGLAVADANTIYGGGNWYDDSAYIIKSVDGGKTWSFIDMSQYASSIIDLFFLNKDVGFATGKGKLPLESGVILYTTDGGATWSFKFQNNLPNEYCWKIQRINNYEWAASLEDFANVHPEVLRSSDGGMTWSVKLVSAERNYDIEGIGFIDPLRGWTGGGIDYSFKTVDGGNTWDTVHIIPYMNRLFKVNDTMMFASGDRIYRLKNGGFIPPIPATHHAWMTCSPNPAKNNLEIKVSVDAPTHIMLILFDNNGNRINVVENADKPTGSYQYHVNTSGLSMGIYHVVLKTHDDKRAVKVIVSH